MKILIIGAGKVGKKIVDIMELEDHYITVVDSKQEAISEIKRSPKVKTILKDGLDKEFLEELKVKEFDYIVAATDSDKNNILISTLTKSLGGKNTIARINRADSSGQLSYLKKYLGIDYIVNPELETSKLIEKIIKDDIVYQADNFGRGKIEVVEHDVDLDPEFEGNKIKNIGSLATILVIGIFRNDNIIIPDGETVIEKGDRIYLMGLSRDIMNFKMKYFKLEKKDRRKKITIAGSSDISSQISNMCKNHNVTIIEEDREKSKYLRRNMKDALIINTSLEGANFFKEESLSDSDVFIALTENDELNIVLAIMAKKYGINQVIIKVKSLNYMKILDTLGLTAIVNPLTVASNEIIKRLRADKGVSVNLTFNGEAEVLEIELSEKSQVINKNLEEINLPSGIIIGGIIRSDGSAVIPRGKTKLLKGDTIVVFCKKNMKKKLENFIDPQTNRNFLSNFFY